MTSTNKLISQNGDPSEFTQKLMIHGFVCPESSCALSIEVRRGMAILSKDSKDMGQVAAVILDRNSQKATHILLCHLPEKRGYWIIPVDLISEVHDGIVRLAISEEGEDTLPLWRSLD
jgi:sporulation protein YlmC with PRC-barrel domain